MTTDPHARFHAHWLGLVQPTEGLTLTIPVLVDAQLLDHAPRALRDHARKLAPAPTPDAPRRIEDLTRFLTDILELTPPDLDLTPPDDLALYVAEGRQTLRPTHALRALHPRPTPDDAPPAIRAAAPYIALIQDLPHHPPLPLDRPEDTTGPWRTTPTARFDRLLRATATPIGLLTNREVIRLIYAPPGQTTGWLDFRLTDMLSPGGAPILDAFVALLRAERWYSVAPDQTLPALLAQSRDRQTDVTHALADQVFAALETLLDGFDRADARDPDRRFTAALNADTPDDPYAGLLTVLLRLVVLLYAEAHGLLPIEHPLYARNYGLLDLYDRLLDDAAAWPDEMDRRYGAWPRLLATFRAVCFGVEWHHPDHPPLRMPPRQGDLFNPDRFPWLEGRPTTLDRTANADVRTPPIDDGTLLAILHRLIVLDGQRLSYKALDVEQIGSVYERLMGYRIERLLGPAVCIKPARVWLTAHDVISEPANQRERWLQDEAGLPRAAAKRLADAINAAERTAPDHQDPHAHILDAIAAEAGHRDHRRPAGARVLQPGTERRRTSSHYTPRALSAPIVARTIDPLIATITATTGREPTADQLLALTLCDPAMGSGAFLVEACRHLAARVVAAWTRDGLPDPDAADPDLHLRARRLVAQRCLYGVDKNRFAVELARISLWLVTMARDEPFTFVDHALRWGDSLVGLGLDQIQSFHWQPDRQLTLVSAVIRDTLEETVERRAAIRALAESPDTAEKRRLLDDALTFTERARLIADVCVGAFFAHAKPAAREKERKRRLALVDRWLRDDPADDEVMEIDAELRAMQETLRAEVPAFHWMIEFPEVFWAERPDPLSGGKAGVAWIDGIVGNPPFLGGRRIRSEVGDAYTEWMGAAFGGSLNADICARFFQRADELLGPHGAMGLVATNSIAEADSREAALAPLLDRKRTGGAALIYDATAALAWPGDAAVTVAIVHIAKGAVRAQIDRVQLNGERVAVINSHLQPSAERPSPSALKANDGRSYNGAFVNGVGFLLTQEERDALLARDPRNAERIFPYIGGREINTSPTHAHDRYVISFGSLTLKEAEAWPDLIQIVRERVKPARDLVRRDAHRRYWWQFGDKRPALFEAISGLKRCLVNSQVSKHLVFAWQPTDVIWAHTLYVYPVETAGWFAVLQSRVHEPWAWLLSSSMKTDLRYSPSDCFNTFPFPPDLTDPALEAAGEALYTARAAHMIRHDQGLTTTYNQLKDPDIHDPEITHLRRLHDAMDRAVLAAYGWHDLTPPPYGTATADEQQAFDDEIIDRLFVLNAERAAAERAAALISAPAARAKAGAASPGGGTPAAAPAARKPRAPRKRAAPAEPTLPLDLDDPTG